MPCRPRRSRPCVAAAAPTAPRLHARGAAAAAQSVVASVMRACGSLTQARRRLRRLRRLRRRRRRAGDEAVLAAVAAVVRVQLLLGALRRVLAGEGERRPLRHGWSCSSVAATGCSRAAAVVAQAAGLSWVPPVRRRRVGGSSFAPFLVAARPCTTAAKMATSDLLVGRLTVEGACGRTRRAALLAISPPSARAQSCAPRQLARPRRLCGQS